LSNDAVASDHVRFRISFLKSSPSCISGEVCLFLNKYLETFHRNGNPSGDYFALFTSLEISKPPKQRKTVSYRKFSEINTTDLIQDLNNSKIVQNREGSVVNAVKL
jgi:hypothetical protein